VARAYNCLLLHLLVHQVTVRFKRLKEDLFLACFVRLILTQKILDLRK